MDTNINYQKKYLKYKFKYLELKKKQDGGFPLFSSKTVPQPKPQPKKKLTPEQVKNINDHNKHKEMCAAILRRGDKNKECETIIYGVTTKKT